MLNFLLSHCRFFATAISAFWLVGSCTPPNLDARTDTSVTPLESGQNPLDGTLWELKAIESGEVTLSMPDKPRLFAEFNNSNFHWKVVATLLVVTTWLKIIISK
jgi:hypothetical protein